MGLNGRILLGFDGIHKTDNSYLAGFSVQPLADMTGSMNLDNAVFFFGQENDWQVKVGRFEAYDMFLLNQDTFVEHSGNTANDLYSDGHGYIYTIAPAMAWNGLKSDPDNGVVMNLNTAYMDASNEKLSQGDDDNRYGARVRFKYFF